MSLSIIGGGFIGTYVSKIMYANRMNHFLHNSQSFNLCTEDTWKNLSPCTEQVLITAGSMSNSVKELKSVNENSLKALCGYLKKTGVNKIIFISSGAVYGNYPYDTYPGIECNPSSPYGISKLNAERILLEYWKGLLNIVRLYFTYGPLQKKPRLVPNLIDKIKKKEAISINKDGGPTITLNHVEDVALHLVETFINKNHEVVIENLASPFTITIKDLAFKLAEFLGEKPVFKISETDESNHTSVPFPSNWEKAGYLEDIFDVI